MEKLYIVFDQIPEKTSGGLLGTYKTLLKVLEKEYEVEIISIFDTSVEAKLVFENHTVHIISNYKIDNRFYRLYQHLREGNFKKLYKSVASLIYYFMYPILSKHKLKKLINKNDKVIVSCPSAAIFMPSSRPFILEIHGSYDFFWKGNFVRKLQILLMTKPKLILFRNKSDYAKAKKHMDNVSYIYNSCERVEINNSITKTNKIIYIGRISSEKDPIRMLKLANILKNKYGNFHIDVYGKGPLEEQLSTIINELNLDSHVTLRGYVEDKSIYQKYSFLLMTSKTEGFPLTIIEAKANGVPVISTVWGDAVGEVISQGNTGYYGNNDDDLINYMIQLLTDNKKLKQFSTNALLDYEKYSINSLKKNWLYVLNNYKK